MNSKNKTHHKIWIRIIAAVVVCLFVVNDLVWANPDILSQPSQKASLQPPDVITAPSVEKSIEYAVKAYLETVPDLTQRPYHLRPEMEIAGVRFDPDLFFGGNELSGSCLFRSKRYEFRIDLSDRSVRVQEKKPAQPGSAAPTSDSAGPIDPVSVPYQQWRPNPPGKLPDKVRLLASYEEAPKAIEKCKEYAGEVYYPCAGVDVDSVMMLINVFPKASRFVFNDVFNQEDSLVTMPDPRDIRAVMNHIASNFKPLVLDLGTVTVQVIDNKQIKITITIEDEVAKRALNRESIEILYRIGDYKDEAGEYGMIYVQRPGLAGRLSEEAVFWKKLMANLDDDGYIIASSVCTNLPDTPDLRMVGKVLPNSTFDWFAHLCEWSIYEKVAGSGFADGLTAPSSNAKGEEAFQKPDPIIIQHIKQPYSPDEAPAKLNIISASEYGRKMVGSFADYAGEVYYPCAGADQFSVKALLSMFPKASRFVMTDIFDQRETPFPLPNANDIKGIMQYMAKNFSLLAMNVGTVRIEALDRSLIKITIAVEDQAARQSLKRDSVEIVFKMNDYLKEDQKFGVIYVQIPGYGGRLSKTSKFWDKMSSQLAENGFVVVGTEATYQPRSPELVRIATIEPNVSFRHSSPWFKYKIYQKPRDPKALRSDLLLEQIEVVNPKYPAIFRRVKSEGYSNLRRIFEEEFGMPSAEYHMERFVCALLPYQAVLLRPEDLEGMVRLCPERSQKTISSMMAFFVEHIRPVLDEMRPVVSAKKRDRFIKAFFFAPRHLFMPDSMRNAAYRDLPFAIGEDQTISQPSTVARMSLWLDIDPESKPRVLEVGTGSGWQAAILHFMGAEIYTVERKEGLYKVAQARFKALGMDGINVHLGDGTKGLPDKAPFARIMVSAGAPAIPGDLKAQLSVGGKLLCPVKSSRDESFDIKIFRRNDPLNSAETTVAERYLWVPLVGEDGYKDEKLEEPSQPVKPETPPGSPHDVFKYMLGKKGAKVAFTALEIGKAPEINRASKTIQNDLTALLAVGLIDRQRSIIRRDQSRVEFSLRMDRWWGEVDRLPEVLKVLAQYGHKIHPSKYIEAKLKIDGILERPLADAVARPLAQIDPDALMRRLRVISNNISEAQGDEQLVKAATDLDRAYGEIIRMPETYSKRPLLAEVQKIRSVLEEAKTGLKFKRIMRDIDKALPKCMEKIRYHPIAGAKVLNALPEVVEIRAKLASLGSYNKSYRDCKESVLRYEIDNKVTGSKPSKSGKSFDSAQDKPFGTAQGKPFAPDMAMKKRPSRRIASILAGVILPVGLTAFGQAPDREAAIIQKVEAQISRLQGGDYFTNRPAVVASLVAMGPEAIDAIADVVDSAYPILREVAAEALGQIGTGRSIEPLIKALKDSERVVRERAVESLVKIGPAAIRPLVEVFYDQSHVHSEAAIQALAGIGESAIPAIMPVLDDERWEVRAAAARAYIKMRGIPDGNAWLLVKLLPSVDAAVDRALSNLGRPGEIRRAIVLLIKDLQKRDMIIRHSAASALANIGSPAAEALTAALGDKNEFVREAAAYALGRMKEKAAAGALKRLLDDPDWLVRRQAARSYIKIEMIPGNDTALLIKLLPAGTYSVTQRFIALGDAAIAPLNEAAGLADANMRAAADGVLYEIKHRREADERRAMVLAAHPKRTPKGVYIACALFVLAAYKAIASKMKDRDGSGANPRPVPAAKQDLSPSDTSPDTRAQGKSFDSAQDKPFAPDMAVKKEELYKGRIPIASILEEEESMRNAMGPDEVRRICIDKGWKFPLIKEEILARLRKRGVHFSIQRSDYPGLIAIFRILMAKGILVREIKSVYRRFARKAARMLETAKHFGVSKNVASFCQYCQSLNIMDQLRQIHEEAMEKDSRHQLKVAKQTRAREASERARAIRELRKQEREQMKIRQKLAAEGATKHTPAPGKKARSPSRFENDISEMVLDRSRPSEHAEYRIKEIAGPDEKEKAIKILRKIAAEELEKNRPLRDEQLLMAIGYSLHGLGVAAENIRKTIYEPQTPAKPYATDMAMKKSDRGGNWFAKIPREHRVALAAYVREAFAADPRLINLDLQHQLLARRGYWLDFVQKDGGWNRITPDQFGLSVAAEFAKSASDLNIYYQLIKIGLVKVTEVESILDLGSGYWNYADMLPCAFPGLRYAVGIESDTAKLRQFETVTAPALKLDPNRYVALAGDMKDLRHNRALQDHIRQHGTFTTALLQNPQVGFSQEEYRNVLYGVSNLLSEDGKLIITVDNVRMGEDGNPALMESLQKISATHFTDKRIPNIISSIFIRAEPVHVFVVSKSELAKLAPPAVTSEPKSEAADMARRKDAELEKKIGSIRKNLRAFGIEENHFTRKVLTQAYLYSKRAFPEEHGVVFARALDLAEHLTADGIAPCQTVSRGLPFALAFSEEDHEAALRNINALADFVYDLANEDINKLVPPGKMIIKKADMRFRNELIYKMLLDIFRALELIAPLAKDPGEFPKALDLSRKIADSFRLAQKTKSDAGLSMLVYLDPFLKQASDLDSLEEAMGRDHGKPFAPDMAAEKGGVSLHPGIRPARLEDAARIRELSDALWKDPHFRRDIEYYESAIRGWEYMGGGALARVWVYCDAAGEVQGYIYVTSKDGYAYIQEMAVAEGHRRRGIGTALLALVLKEMLNLGGTKFVSRFSGDSINIAKRRGFVFPVAGSDYGYLNKDGVSPKSFDIAQDIPFDNRGEGKPFDTAQGKPFAPDMAMEKREEPAQSPESKEYPTRESVIMELNRRDEMGWPNNITALSRGKYCDMKLKKAVIKFKVIVPRGHWTHYRRDAMTYYEILGLPYDASREEVIKAFRTMIMKYHPDKHAGLDNRLVRDLIKAHTTLQDDVKRRRYDKQLSTGFTHRHKSIALQRLEGLKGVTLAKGGDKRIIHLKAEGLARLLECSVGRLPFLLNKINEGLIAEGLNPFELAPADNKIAAASRLQQGASKMTMMEKALVFGKNVRALREKKKISRADLEKAIGVRSGKISQWEQGKALPFDMYRERIAQYFGVKQSDLLPGQADDTFGARFRRYLARAGFTQSEFVRRSGFGYVAVTRWATDQEVPHPVNVEKIARLLKIKVSDLMPYLKSETFGSRLRSLRADACLTQKQVADKARISQATLSRLESDWMGPSPLEIEKIARFFNVEITDLIPDARPPETFGRRLRKLIARQGLMIKEFAVLVGVHRLLPGLWGMDKAFPTPSQMESIERFFNVKASAIINGGPEFVEALNRLRPVAESAKKGRLDEIFRKLEEELSANRASRGDISSSQRGDASAAQPGGRKPFDMAQGKPFAPDMAKRKPLTVSPQVHDIMKDGEIVMKASDGQLFIFRFRTERESDDKTLLILNVFTPKDGAEELVGYAHAMLIETASGDWEKFVLMRVALEHNSLADMPLSPAIKVSELYRQRYLGIGRTMMSLLMQIGQSMRAHRFVAEEVFDDSVEFYKGLGMHRTPPRRDEGSSFDVSLMPEHGYKFPAMTITRKDSDEIASQDDSAKPFDTTKGGPEPTDMAKKSPRARMGTYHMGEGRQRLKDIVKNPQTSLAVNKDLEDLPEMLRTMANLFIPLKFLYVKVCRPTEAPSKIFLVDPKDGAQDDRGLEFLHKETYEGLLAVLLRKLGGKRAGDISTIYKNRRLNVEVADNGDILIKEYAIESSQEAPDMAARRPGGPHDRLSDGDTTNPFIIKHIAEGRAIELYEEGRGAVRQIISHEAQPRSPPLDQESIESFLRSKGVFSKIRRAKDPGLLNKILREKKNFRNLSPQEAAQLIKIVKNIPLSIILGHAIIGEREEDYILTHVRTGFSSHIHGLKPTIWIGQLLLQRLKPEQLAQLLLEEAHHILKPPKKDKNGRWINKHGKISRSKHPEQVIEHDAEFVKSLYELARMPEPQADRGFDTGRESMWTHRNIIKELRALHKKYERERSELSDKPLGSFATHLVAHHRGFLETLNNRFRRMVGEMIYLQLDRRNRAMVDFYLDQAGLDADWPDMPRFSDIPDFWKRFGDRAEYRKKMAGGVLSEMVKKSMPWLTKYGWKILVLRHGLYGNRPHTIEEISRKVRFTEHFVRMKLQFIYELLRRPYRARRILEALDEVVDPKSDTGQLLSSYYDYKFEPPDMAMRKEPHRKLSPKQLAAVVLDERAATAYRMEALDKLGDLAKDSAVKGLAAFPLLDKIISSQSVSPELRADAFESVRAASWSTVVAMDILKNAILNPQTTFLQKAEGCNTLIQVFLKNDTPNSLEAVLGVLSSNRMADEVRFSIFDGLEKALYRMDKDPLPFETLHRIVIDEKSSRAVRDRARSILQNAAEKWKVSAAALALEKLKSGILPNETRMFKPLKRPAVEKPGQIFNDFDAGLQAGRTDGPGPTDMARSPKLKSAEWFRVNGKEYRIEIASGFDEMAAQVERWFQTIKKSDFSESGWLNAIKERDAFLVKIVSADGTLAGETIFYKKLFMFPEKDMPEDVFIGAYIEVLPHLRGTGIGRVLISKAVEKILKDPSATERQKGNILMEPADRDAALFLARLKFYYRFTDGTGHPWHSIARKYARRLVQVADRAIARSRTAENSGQMLLDFDSVSPARPAAGPGPTDMARQRRQTSSPAGCLRDWYDNRAMRTESLTMEEISILRPYGEKATRNEIRLLVELGLVRQDTEKRPYKYRLEKDIAGSSEEMLRKICALAALNQPDIPDDKISALRKEIDGILAVKWPQFSYHWGIFESSDNIHDRILAIQAIADGFSDNPHAVDEAIIKKILYRYIVEVDLRASAGLIHILAAFGMKFLDVKRDVTYILESDQTPPSILIGGIEGITGAVVDGLIRSLDPQIFHLIRRAIFHKESEVVKAGLVALNTVMGNSGFLNDIPLLKKTSLVQDEELVARLKELRGYRDVPDVRLLALGCLNALGFHHAFTRKERRAVRALGEGIFRMGGSLILPGEYARQNAQKLPQLSDDELSRLYLAIRDKGTSPVGHLENLFENGRQAVFLAHGSYDSPLPISSTEVLKLIETAGLTHLALPIPASAAGDLRKFIDGGMPTFFQQLDVSEMSLKEDQEAIAGVRGDEELARLRLFLQQLDGKVEFILYNSEDEDQYKGELVAEANSRAIVEVAQASPSSRILVLSNLLDASKEDIVTEDGAILTASTAKAVRRRLGDEKVASVFCTSKPTLAVDSVTSIHNLSELIDKYPLPDSFAVDVSGTPLERIRFYDNIRTTMGEAWNSIIVRKGGDDDRRGGAEKSEPPPEESDWLNAGVLGRELAGIRFGFFPLDIIFLVLGTAAILAYNGWILFKIFQVKAKFIRYLKDDAYGLLDMIEGKDSLRVVSGLRIFGYKNKHGVIKTTLRYRQIRPPLLCLPAVYIYGLWEFLERVFAGADGREDLEAHNLKRMERIYDEEYSRAPDIQALHFKRLNRGIFVPSHIASVSKVLGIIKEQYPAAKTFFDFGSGAGEVVNAALFNGFEEAAGVEDEQKLVDFSEHVNGLLAAESIIPASGAKFRQGDAYTEDLSKYDVIFIADTDGLDREKLQEKINREAKPECIVIINHPKVAFAKFAPLSKWLELKHPALLGDAEGKTMLYRPVKAPPKIEIGAQARAMGDDESKKLGAALIEELEARFGKGDVTYRGEHIYGDRRISSDEWYRLEEDRSTENQVKMSACLYLERIGYLFFIKKDGYVALSDALKARLGSNVVFVDDLEHTVFTGSGLPSHTRTTIATMMCADIKGKRVVDAGSAEGFLSLAALKLGATSVDMVENNKVLTDRADVLFGLNGFILGRDYRVYCEDLKDAEKIVGRIPVVDEDTVIISNIGTWPKLYKVDNSDSMRLAGYINNVTLFIGAGYFRTQDPKLAAFVADKAMEFDRQKIGRLGFEVDPLCVITDTGLSQIYAWIARRPRLQKPGEAVDAASEITASQAVTQTMLRDPTALDTLAQCLKEETISLAFNQKLVLAFDDNIALYQAEHPLNRVLKALKELKENPKYEKALGNLAIVHGSTGELQELIKKEMGSNKGRVFVFAPDSDEIRRKLGAIEAAQHTFIDEKGFEMRAYYPLAEIVVIALAQHFDKLVSEGDIKKALKIDGKDFDLSKVNIESIKMDGNAIIFKLLPNAREHNTQDLIQRYAAITKFLEAA